MLLVAAVAMAQVNYSRELEQRAENGNAQAMYELSQCYRFGKGVEKSMRLANQWVIRAAEAGYAEAISFCDEMGLQFTPKLLATIYFPHNSSRITPVQQEVVVALAEVMKTENCTYTITGWPDNFTGTDEINKKLRIERAQSVKNALIRLGIASSRMIIKVDAGDRSRNRAVTIVRNR